MGLVVAIAAAAVSAGSEIMKSQAQSSALDAKSEIEDRISAINARQSEILANDAILRGDREARILSDRAGALAGDQLSAYAASGVEISSATVQAVILKSRRDAVDDIVTVRTNALREAFNLRSEASNVSLSRRLNSMAYRNAADSGKASGYIDAFSSGMKSASAFGAFQSNPEIAGDVPTYSRPSGSSFEYLPDDLGLA